MILWNAEHHIYFMRVSSELLPFAAHAEYGYDIACVEKELKKAGDAANELGMRLTTHPGQYTQLGSPTKKVVDNAIADLEYHARMLTLMGMGKDSVMIIHGGECDSEHGPESSTDSSNSAQAALTTTNRLRSPASSQTTNGSARMFEDV